MKTMISMVVKLFLLVSIINLIGCDSAKKQPDNYQPKNIIVVIIFKAKPDKGVEAVDELTKLIEKVKQEPHFVNVKLHVDPKDKTNIMLYEEWNDESYYNSEHMNTSHLQEFIANSRDFLTGPPEISFWNIEKEFKP